LLSVLMRALHLVCQLVVVLVSVLFGCTFGANCGNPQTYAGRSLCDHAGGYCGECVSFYKICTGDRRTTSQWIQGAKVRGASIAIGTGIATFPNGKYYGHTAIYMGQNSEGIQVWDQWVGHPVSTRTIRWNGNGISNNGDSFYVINGGSSSPSSPPSSSSSSSSSSFGSCSANGVSGTCIDTNARQCSGQLHTGKCPGASNIRCCTGGFFAVDDSYDDLSFATDPNNNDALSLSSTTPADDNGVVAAVIVGVVGGVVVVILGAVVIVLARKVQAAQNE